MVGASDDTTVDESIEIKVSVETVWRALLDDDVRAGWWSYLDPDPVVGGQVKETWEGPEGATQTTGDHRAGWQMHLRNLRNQLERA